MEGKRRELGTTRGRVGRAFGSDSGGSRRFWLSVNDVSRAGVRCSLPLGLWSDGNLERRCGLLGEQLPEGDGEADCLSTMTQADGMKGLFLEIYTEWQKPGSVFSSTGFGARDRGFRR